MRPYTATKMTLSGVVFLAVWYALSVYCILPVIGSESIVSGVFRFLMGGMLIYMVYLAYGTYKEEKKSYEYEERKERNKF